MYAAEQKIQAGCVRFLTWIILKRHLASNPRAGVLYCYLNGYLVPRYRVPGYYSAVICRRSIRIGVLRGQKSAIVHNYISEPSERGDNVTTFPVPVPGTVPGMDCLTIVSGTGYRELYIHLLLDGRQIEDRTGPGTRNRFRDCDINRFALHVP